MTTDEFKKKYPQHAHLEGDELWDKMTESFCDSAEIYTADPDREIIYHEPLYVNGFGKVLIENEAETIWINSKGEKVKLVSKIPESTDTTSYRMVIWDASKNNTNEHKK